MTKKDSESSQQRISAVLLGGSLRSSGGSSYKGSLFARKKERNYGKILLVMFLMVLTIAGWELAQRYAPKVAAAISNNKQLRGLASDFLPGNSKKDSNNGK